MSSSDYNRIMDYIFRVPGISDSLRGEFERWMVEHENDPEIEAHLSEMWGSLQLQETDRRDERGFRRLLNSIERRRSRLRRALLYAGAAAALAIFFFGGYFIAANRTASYHEITLVTGESSRGDYTLPDGTKVWLNGGSSLSYRAGLVGSVRKVRLEGEGYFEVARDSLRPFRVDMGDVSVEVLGTEFDAINNSFSSKRTVILKSGSVKVTSDRLKGNVTLQPGDKIEIDRESGRTEIRPVDIENYCSWFAPRLVFDNSTVADIITNLERRYSIDISVAPGILLDGRFSFTIGSEPLEDIMDILCSMMPITYKIEDRHMTIM